MVEYSNQDLDEVFHALADPTRRAMLRDLNDGEQRVSDLAAPHAMSLAAASKHVRVLERAGLLKRRIEGRTHWCRLDPQPLGAASAWLQFYTGFWNDHLDVLAAALATGEGSADDDNEENHR